MKKIVDSNHIHENDDENFHAKIRQYFMNFVVRANIKQQHFDDAISKQIFFFIRNKYDEKNFNNSIIDSKNVYNVLNRIRKKKLKNITTI